MLPPNSFGRPIDFLRQVSSLLCPQAPPLWKHCGCCPKHPLPALLQTIVNPHLWNGRIDPYLYEAVVEVSINGLPVDRVKQPLGLRFFRVDPEQGLILNGKPYDMHGVNYHEGRTSVGFADSQAMEEEDNRLICDMGCTGVRMAHNQHNDYEYTLCDRHGLIVWTELALVNKMTDTPEFRENVKQQLMPSVHPDRIDGSGAITKNDTGRLM
jgi:beta-galactosidase